MKQFETGRTMIETLGVLAFIGILTLSGLSLYSKAMNTIRANYIMEQVFIQANQLVQAPVAARHKMVDATVQGGENAKLAYGFKIGSRNLDENTKTVSITLEGNFPKTLCKILRKKIDTQEFAGLEDISGADNCEGKITEMTFVISSSFQKTRKTKKYSNYEYETAKNTYQAEIQGNNDKKSCMDGALTCDPLVCNISEGWYEFDDAPGHCEQCSPGFICEQ